MAINDAVREGERTCLEARAKAEPANDVITADYYARLPQIHLTPDLTGCPMQLEKTMDVTFDRNYVTKRVECAIGHSHFNMRYAVLGAIWNHSDTFRQIFRFVASF